MILWLPFSIAGSGHDVKNATIGLVLALGLAACQLVSDDRRGEPPLPKFVKADRDLLAYLHQPGDDLYIFNTFYDAGSKEPRMDLQGGIVVLDGVSIYVTSFDEVSMGSLRGNSDGWTMEQHPPQCVTNCSGAKARLLDMLRAGAKITIDRQGSLVVRSPDGSWASGVPMRLDVTD